MLISTPCPKCRDSVLVGVSRCSHCGYRLVPWEIRRGVLMFGLKLLMGMALIGTLLYVIRES